MAINIEWQVKSQSKVWRTSERTQYETAPKNAGTCIGLRRYLHEATQVSALKPHSFKGQRDRYVGSQSFLPLLSLPSGFSGPALPTSTLQNYIQSSEPPNMVCR